MVLVSAPGKVHLIGEHAVVYGHPAILAAVGKRTYVEAGKSRAIEINDIRFNRKERWSLEEVENAFKEAKTLLNQCAEKGNYSELLFWAKDGGTYNANWKALIGTVLEGVSADSGISINIYRSEIPNGSGLGSSSSAAVAIAKAVDAVYERDLGLDKINSIAYECERLAHGSPSGGDNTACCYGDLVWFQKSKPNNVLIPLGNEIPYKLENFVFVYTKRPEKSTGELIEMVRRIPEAYRNSKMQELDKMTYEMKEVLKNRDYESMKQMINKTNDILSSFGLSTKETTIIHNKIKSMGGASKMCGACGGGIMLAWHENPQEIMNEIEKLGFIPFKTDLAVDGVKVESI
jgi:mevalonate kinase